MLAMKPARSSSELFPASGSFRSDWPMPGMAATGARSCGGSMLVKPSLTSSSALRPSLSDPIREISDSIADSDTWFRIFSTTSAG